MWRERKTDARRRGDTPPMAGGIPRPRQGAPGTARGQGASRGNSSDGLVIATFEAVAGGAAAAARAAGAFPGGTRGADLSRALRAAAATAATAAGAAAQLLACHVAWPSEAEAGPRKAPPPCPKASPADEAAPSPGRGSARTVSRRMRRTGARDAAGLQAEAEVAEGGRRRPPPRQATTRAEMFATNRKPRQNTGNQTRRSRAEGATSQTGRELTRRRRGTRSRMTGARSRRGGGRRRW